MLSHYVYYDYSKAVHENLVESFSLIRPRLRVHIDSLLKPASPSLYCILRYIPWIHTLPQVLCLLTRYTDSFNPALSHINLKSWIRIEQLLRATHLLFHYASLICEVQHGTSENWAKKHLSFCHYRLFIPRQKHLDWLQFWFQIIRYPLLTWSRFSF